MAGGGTAIKSARLPARRCVAVPGALHHGLRRCGTACGTACGARRVLRLYTLACHSTALRPVSSSR